MEGVGARTRKGIGIFAALYPSNKLQQWNDDPNWQPRSSRNICAATKIYLFPGELLVASWNIKVF